MEDISLTTIVISIIASATGSLLVAYYLKRRERNIKKKIQDTHEYEDYLEKLSKGNIKLLRSTLLIILISISVFAFTLILIVLLSIHSFPSIIKSSMIGLDIGFLAAIIYGCIYQAKAIVQSANLKDAKQSLEEKRNKLENKIT